MLLLEEKAYRALSESKRELYVLQWLQNLPQAIRGTPRVREGCVACTLAVGRELNDNHAAELTLVRICTERQMKHAMRQSSWAGH